MEAFMVRFLPPVVAHWRELVQSGLRWAICGTFGMCRFSYFNRSGHHYILQPDARLRAVEALYWTNRNANPHCGGPIFAYRRRAGAGDGAGGCGPTDYTGKWTTTFSALLDLLAISRFSKDFTCPCKPRPTSWVQVHRAPPTIVMEIEITRSMQRSQWCHGNAVCFAIPR